MARQDKMNDLDDRERVKSTLHLAREHLSRCQRLINELKQLQSFLVSQKMENIVDIRVFQSHVSAELKSLHKHLAENPATERTSHALHSSNFPFQSTLWDAAKTSRGLIAISRRFFWEQGLNRLEKNAGKRKKQSALVDIVAESGKRWIKISTVTESRLLFDLAKAGWERDSEGSDDSDEGTVSENELGQGRINLPSSSDAESEVEIVRLARDLQRASQATFVDYEHPEIVFLLPRLPKHGHSPEIDRILAKVKATGAKIHCGPIELPDLALDDLFQRMIASDIDDPSAELNIDCTILLALVSDLSHCSAADLLQRPDAPQYHPVINRQIAGEEERALLPHALYPVLKDRQLVCTREAAKRMREIVDTMGTATEKARTGIFIGGEHAEESLSEDGHRTPSTGNALADLSVHTTPSLTLPIKVVESQMSSLSRTLPAAATSVGSKLSTLNKSVFFYGWAENITTITSNRAIATEIEQTIIDLKKNNEEHRHLKGPRLWLCDTARSLVGKEKNRKN